MTSTTRAAVSPFVHDAFVYESDAEYVGVLAPLLESASAGGDVCMAVVPERNAALLAECEIPDLHTVPAEEWYRHPGRTLVQYDGILRRLAPGSKAFVVGEVQFGTTRRQHQAWTRYESALNRALAAYHARVVCPYDARTLPADVVEDARRTHPHVLEPSAHRPSDRFVAPEDLVPALTSPLVPPERTPDLELAASDTLSALRPLLRAAVSTVGFDDEQVEELVLGLHEVLANAALHGGGRGRLRMWWVPGQELWCTVEDGGPGCADPLAGFSRPGGASEHGYGLWLARGLFDECELGPSSLGGLAVTMVARRDPA